MSKEIKLTKGMSAIVDDSDYPEISKHMWQAFISHGIWYAVRNKKKSDGKSSPKMIRMHRVILCPPKGVNVDHANGNGLDNRRSNLRLAFGGQNQHNSKKRSDNTSGYKGICMRKDTKRWLATICVSNKQIHLGYFATKEEAARAYDDAARKYFGEFARTNF